MSVFTFLLASLADVTETHAEVASLPEKRDLRTSPGPRFLEVVFCAALLVCLASASASAQAQTVEHVVGRSVHPEGGAAGPLDTNGFASVVGTVLDLSGGSVAGAEITLMHGDGTKPQTMMSGANGEFHFVKILEGSYVVIVNAGGFARFTSAEFTVTVGRAYELPDISLSLAATNVEVTVRPGDEIAAEEIRVEEKQRLIGVIPNFYTSYIYAAAPLTGKQKFALAIRGTFDPVSVAGVSIAAGLEQATNAYAGYGQGAAGYGKRFAAKFVDGRDSDMLTHAVFPALLHQDPRYYYQGYGTVKARILHAVGSAFVTRSDSGRTVPNSSYLLGDACAGALSNLYYPRANRGAHLVFTIAGVGLAGRVGGNLLRELLAKRWTRNAPSDGTP